ncbi:TPA: BspA family leucine-rich repeat surface protein [Campylobacter jejuni]
MESVSLGQIDLSYIKNLNQLFASYSMEIIHLRTNRKDFSGIESWDVSKIKDMNQLFTGLKDFNADLSKWKVTNVKDFEYMFCNCESFKSDLSKWRPKKAENINSMFHGAKSFDCDLSEWNLPSELVEQSKNIFSNCPLQNNPPSWYKAVFDMDNPSYELLCKLVKARDYKQAKIILEKILPLQNEQYQHITQLCFYVPKGTVSNAMPDEDFFSALIKNAKSQGFHIPISDKVMHTCLRFDRLEYAKFLRTLGYKVVITKENEFGLSVALKQKFSTKIKNILEFILDNLDSKIDTAFFENIGLDGMPNRRFCHADDETLDFFFQELIKRYPKEMTDKKLLVMFVHSDLIYLLFKHGLKIDLKNIPYDLNIVGRYYLGPIDHQVKGRVSRFLQLLRHNLLRADSIIEYTGVKVPALLIFLDNFKHSLDLDGEECPIKDILIEFASHNVDIQKLGTFRYKDFYEILKQTEYEKEILALFQKPKG